eukprot:1461049-Rhodomonas_salina.1
MHRDTVELARIRTVTRTAGRLGGGVSRASPDRSGPHNPHHDLRQKESCVVRIRHDGGIKSHSGPVPHGTRVPHPSFHHRRHHYCKEVAPATSTPRHTVTH